jgi:hypothetical protein
MAVNSWRNPSTVSLRRILCALIMGVMLAPVAVRANSGEPGRCSNDSKLLNGGPTMIYGEGPGTWWGLVINGLDAAGFAADEEKIAYLNHIFGTSFDSLALLKIYNQTLVADNWDQNQNGYVCAYELRGTRAYLGDPFINLTYFGISDDKVTH